MIKQELLESRAFQKAGDDAKFFFLPLPYRGSKLFRSRLSTPLTVSHENGLIHFGRRGNPITKKDLLSNENFLKAVFGKLFADKGYISEQLAKILFVSDIHLITSIRNNMKNSLMTMNDKIMLRKRSVIETVNDELKNICQVEHSRHRSFTNFITNIIAGLIAYSFFPKKPSINYQTTQSNQIFAF